MVTKCSIREIVHYPENSHKLPAELIIDLYQMRYKQEKFKELSFLIFCYAFWMSNLNEIDGLPLDRLLRTKKVRLL